MGLMVGLNEMVMPENSQITATTSVGTITITAGKGFLRCYTWEGVTGCVTLAPRKQRWFGSFGAYFPGFMTFWRTHDGLDRAVVQEGQLHFDSIAEFESFFQLRAGTIGSPMYEPHVYRDDGLVVAWSKTPARKELLVEVFQAYINNKKPTALPDSQNDKIQVRMVSSLPHDDLSKRFYLF
jgi:hypothetical protein